MNEYELELARTGKLVYVAVFKDVRKQFKAKWQANAWLMNEASRQYVDIYSVEQMIEMGLADVYAAAKEEDGSLRFLDNNG